MSIAYELSKVKNAFIRVRDDMNFLSGKISENYDEFMSHHKKLANQVESISENFRVQIEELRKSAILHSGMASEKEMMDLKGEIKELKAEVMKLQKKHYDVETVLSDVKRTGKDVKQLSEKLNSSELELFLLKEKLAEKDVEIKQIKDVNRHMYKIIEELSQIELEILNSNMKAEGRK